MDSIDELDPSKALYLGADVASRPRWGVSSLLGTALGVAAIIVSHLIPAILFGRVEGLAYGLVGLLQLALVPLAVWIGLKPVGISLKTIGLRGPRVGRDAALGLAVAAIFAIAQFTILIPATGGADRSDIVVAVAQIGGPGWGGVGLIALAWTGGFAEELLFRGHLLQTLRNALGESQVALGTAAFVTVVVFAALHGYQGWAGAIDTGFYGGVVLTALFILTGGRLTACVIAHAGWNTLAVLGLYLWF